MHVLNLNSEQVSNTAVAKLNRMFIASHHAELVCFCIEFHCSSIARRSFVDSLFLGLLPGDPFWGNWGFWGRVFLGRILAFVAFPKAIPFC